MADASNSLPSTDNTSLTCAARVLGYECADPNLEFLRCKANNADPRACLPQGEKVTACVLKTYVPYVLALCLLICLWSSSSAGCTTSLSAAKCLD